MIEHLKNIGKGLWYIGVVLAVATVVVIVSTCEVLVTFDMASWSRATSANERRFIVVQEHLRARIGRSTSLQRLV